MNRTGRRLLLVFALALGCGGGGPLPNYAPVAVDDVASTPADQPLTIDVLANDFDWENDTLTVESAEQPAGGSTVVESDGSITYDPPTAFTGFESFTYTISDATGKTDTATVVVAVGVTVQLTLTEAKGLFEPGAAGVGTYTPGYLSADNAGRIYVNRVYDPGDPTQTTWTKNMQYVDFTLDVQPSAVPWPADARIVWEVLDPDDPSNEDVAVHAEAKDTLDPNDSNGADDDADGTADNSDGNDNTGGRDGAEVWEELDAAWALSNGNETLVSGGLSKVRLNATDDGGDNFIVKASVKLSAEGEPFETQSTGVMTVWKRIDVDYAKMATAVDIAGLTDGEANLDLAKAFVELAVVKRDVADVLAMGVNEYAAGAACDEYVLAPPTGEFTEEGSPGWFFAAAAHKFVDTGAGGPPPKLWPPDPDPAGQSLVWQDGVTLELPIGETLAETDRYQEGTMTGDLGMAGDDYVMKTDMAIPQADLFVDGTVLFDWNPFTLQYDSSGSVVSHTQGAGGGDEITYAAAGPATVGGQVLVFKTYVSAVYMWKPVALDDAIVFFYDNFSWNAGNRTFRVLPKGYSTPTQYDAMVFNLHAHGFASLSVQYIAVYGTGALYVGGISPGPNGGLEGRTIVFTADGGDLNTLLHELGHAFGFHHICGNWDYMSDLVPGNGCAMHYASLNFMLDHSAPRKLDLWKWGPEGPYYCEEHIDAIRRQNLEDLPKLGWGN